MLEPALIDWLPRQRWFGAKTRTIESVRVGNWVELAPDDASGPADFGAAGLNKRPRFRQPCFSSM